MTSKSCTWKESEIEGKRTVLFLLFEIQVGETQPFINEILDNLNSIICDLSPPQVHVFYEAVGCIISAEHDERKQDDLIERLMNLPNTVWDEIITHATQVQSTVDPCSSWPQAGEGGGADGHSPSTWFTSVFLRASFLILQSVEILKEPDVVKNLANILKTNNAACRSIGNQFLVQVIEAA